MKGIKCSECGLTNFRSETMCRRCGRAIGEYKAAVNNRRNPREAAKRSSWLYTVLIITLIGGGAYYLYNGILQSFEQIQPQQQQPPPRSATNLPQPATRTESDRQRAEPYKNAVRNSQGVAESERRTAETQKLTQPVR